MNTWEINGLSLELDLGDADVAERYEKAFDEIENDKDLIPEDIKHSEKIRAYCKVFRNLYDRIFGEGTSDKIFEGVPTSIKASDEIYLSFLDFVQKQMISAAKERAEWRAKFLPKRKNKS